MQDERDSGSDGEDDVNEQHSGSDTGSVERHSEVLANQHLWEGFSLAFCETCYVIGVAESL